MNKLICNISFQEMARRGVEQLKKQQPVTFKQAKEQTERIKKRIEESVKKTRPDKKK